MDGTGKREERKDRRMSCKMEDGQRETLKKIQSAECTETIKVFYKHIAFQLQ